MGSSMSKLDFLQGAYCPLIVPFRDGKIDFDTYGRLIERQIVEGSHGLLVNATSGEPTTLTVEERGQLVEFAIKTSNGRRPVCAGTASESFEATASLIDRSDKVGADSILVVTPLYAAPPQRGAVSYFGKLGARTRRPFLIYHIPGRAGFALTVDTLEAIKDQVPHFVGLKNTDTDVGFVTGALPRLGRGFRIFAGLELPTLPMLGIGRLRNDDYCKQCCATPGGTTLRDVRQKRHRWCYRAELKTLPTVSWGCAGKQPDSGQIHAQAAGRPQGE